MTGESFYESDLYHELRELVEKLDPWYDVDKISWYYVYVWTKDDPNDQQNPYGVNVFDIYADEIIYYVKDHIIPDEAVPLVHEIQEKLEEINRCLED